MTLTIEALRDRLATNVMKWRLDSHDPPSSFYVYWSTPKGEVLYEDWTPDTCAEQFKALIQAAEKLGFKMDQTVHTPLSVCQELAEWVGP